MKLVCLVWLWDGWLGRGRGVCAGVKFNKCGWESLTRSGKCGYGRYWECLYEGEEVFA